MRPAKPLKELEQLSPRELKIIEIENLEKRRDLIQEKINLLKVEINYYPEKAEGRIWLKDILLAVCRYMDFTPEEIQSDRRYKDLVRARSLYLNLCIDLTKHGVTHIARTCGDRDHTTVCHHHKMKLEKKKHWSLDTKEGIGLWSDYTKVKQELLNNITHGYCSEK